MDIRDLYLFFLILTLSLYAPCHAMEKESNAAKKLRPLNWIEREILISGIEEEGMDCMLRKLDKMKTVKNFYIIIDLDLYANHKNKVLNKIIYEAVKIKEKKEPCCTKTVKDKDENVIYNKNNSLGDYTEYWHKTDEQGKNYIRCITIFTNSEVLEDIFIPLQDAFKKEAARILLLIDKTIFHRNL